MLEISKDRLISLTADLKAGIEAIDNAPYKLALVTDDDGNLEGVISDGDVRRALLSGIQLTGAVCDVMNNAPITIHLGASDAEARDLMHKHSIFSLPVLDERCVVGVKTLIKQEVTTLDNLVFIMAGGFGTRLRPLTDECPKPMLPISGKPMLMRLIEDFISQGFKNFCISTHFLPEIIKNYFGDGQALGVNISYVYEELPLGTGGALGLLSRHLTKPVLMINGDILTKIDFRNLINFHNKEKARATMSVRNYEVSVPFGVIEGSDHRITGMIEKPKYNFHVNAGIYIVEPSIINSVMKNEVIDMPTLLERYLSTREVAMFPLHEAWVDIGRREEYDKAQEFYEPKKY